MRAIILFWILGTIFTVGHGIEIQLTRIADYKNESANALSYMCENIRIMKNRDKIWSKANFEETLPPYDEWRKNR